MLYIQWIQYLFTIYLIFIFLFKLILYYILLNIDFFLINVHLFYSTILLGFRTVKRVPILLRLRCPSVYHQAVSHEPWKLES